jgi:hypothetical protein
MDIHDAYKCCILYESRTIMEYQENLEIPPYIRRRHAEEKEAKEREKLEAAAAAGGAKE